MHRFLVRSCTNGTSFLLTEYEGNGDNSFQSTWQRLEMFADALIRLMEGYCDEEEALVALLETEHIADTCHRESISILGNV